jgi:lysophospholipase L1-like esterase
MIKNIKWLLVASLSIVACNKDDETVTEIPVTAGSADFSNYVALGDSFAAGYSDGALFKTAQQTSYPSVIAGQLAAAGGGQFKVPYTNDNFGGLLLGGNPIQSKRLYYTGSSTSPVATVPGTISTEVTNHLSGSFNNLGVPGAKSYHLVASGYGNVAGVASGQANPYYARFSSSATATVLGDAVAQNPSFFSLWIGGNDVLGYALSGGTGVNQTGNLNPATYGSSDITDPNVFANVFNTLVTQLTNGGKKGVVANLPYVSSLPQFTTVPYNPLTSSVLGGGSTTVGDATINQLNTQLYGPLKAALTAFGAGSRINLLSTTAANPLLIRDETLTNLSAQLTAAFTPSLGATTAAFYGNVFGQARQATSADLVPLTTQAAIGAAPTGIPAPLNKNGITYPMQDQYILTADELLQIKVATDAYNTTIASVASAKGLALVDSKAIMAQLTSPGGLTSNGFTITSNFVTGGAFSLDGVHPSPRGYALIANYFLAAINAKYGSTLQPVNVGTYRILFPAVL